MNHPIFSQISRAIQKPLPGKLGHLRMSPVSLDKYREPKTGYKEAGVFLLIYPKADEWYILFIRRTSNHPGDKHAGQISFPGGKKDLEDVDLLACAQRELFEEVGIAKNQYQLLGALSPIFVYVSNFLVAPFVGFSETPLSFVPEVAEVAGLIEWPLSEFLGFANRKIMDMPIRNQTIKNMPYFDLDGQILWGATAMILSEFLLVLEQLNISEDQLKLKLE